LEIKVLQVLRDWGLEKQAGGYVLTAPTEVVEDRMANRWSILFLSQLCDGRGCEFKSLMAANVIKTSADVIGLFYLSAADIMASMQLYAFDSTPTSVSLSSYSIQSVTDISLSFNVVAAEGDTTVELEVSA
jgi:hypothetical protein